MARVRVRNGFMFLESVCPFFSKWVLLSAFVRYISAQEWHQDLPDWGARFSPTGGLYNRRGYLSEHKDHRRRNWGAQGARPPFY